MNLKNDDQSTYSSESSADISDSTSLYASQEKYDTDLKDDSYFEFEEKKYKYGKPQRIVIRAKIIHD
jgi:hypothetical protein